MVLNNKGYKKKKKKAATAAAAAAVLPLHSKHSIVSFESKLLIMPGRLNDE